MIDFNAEKPVRELVPTGNHIARLYSIIEIGHVTEEYMGQEKRMHKIRLTWELPEEKREFDGEQKPMVIGREYTVSLYEGSNLRPIVEGMLGELDEENFDIKELLGKPCMLQVVHKTSKTSGREYALISSAAQLPKGLKAPEQFNPSVYLDYKEGWDDAAYEALPQFIKDDMAESEEMKSRLSGDNVEEEPNPEGIPF